MKSRKVVVTIELWTEAQIKDLKNHLNWDFDDGKSTFNSIEQIQANVIKDDD